MPAPDGSRVMAPNNNSPKTNAMTTKTAISVAGLAFLAGVGSLTAQDSAKKPVTSEEMAKTKNVPAVLEDPQGDYQLVSVIEGAEPNRKLTRNLQVVGAQRQRLLALQQQFDSMPANAFAQRELVAEQIIKVRKTLEQNLRFMAQAYAYSLQNNYRLVPHEATLLLVTEGEDGKPKTEKVHEFNDEASYEAFQKLRNEHLLQTVAEAKEAAAAKETPPVGEAVEEGAVETPAETPDFEPSPELQAMANKLIELYSFDPKKNYQINLEKTALYARRGNQ